VVKYKWWGMDAQGGEHTGITEAFSQDELQRLLFARGVALLQSRRALKDVCTHVIHQLRGCTVHQALFFDGMYTLQSGGLPLVATLELMKSNAACSSLRAVAGQAMHDVLQGMSLSRSLQKRTNLFAEHVVQLIAAGERAGALTPIFKTLGF